MSKKRGPFQSLNCRKCVPIIHLVRICLALHTCLVSQGLEQASCRFFVEHTGLDWSQTHWNRFTQSVTHRCSIHVATQFWDPRQLHFSFSKIFWTKRSPVNVGTDCIIFSNSESPHHWCSVLGRSQEDCVSCWRHHKQALGTIPTELSGWYVPLFLS